MGLKRIWRKLRGRSRLKANGSDRPLPRQALRDADAIVTTNEVCERHGTGVILRRIFAGAPNILSIRSTRLYQDHALGEAHLCLSQEGLGRSESFAHVLSILNGSTVKRVL